MIITLFDAHELVKSRDFYTDRLKLSNKDLSMQVKSIGQKSTVLSVSNL